MKHTKWIVGTAGVLVVGGTFAWLFRPAPILVETARVERGPFTLTIRAARGG
jgi:hypothetical protein